MASAFKLLIDETSELVDYLSSVLSYNQDQEKISEQTDQIVSSSELNNQIVNNQSTLICKIKYTTFFRAYK